MVGIDIAVMAAESMITRMVWVSGSVRCIQSGLFVDEDIKLFLKKAKSVRFLYRLADFCDFFRPTDLAFVREFLHFVQNMKKLCQNVVCVMLELL